MQKSYVLYQLSFLRRGQKKCPLFFKPSIVLSILDVIKHRIHVWYKMYNLKTKAEVNVPSLHPVLCVSVIVADSPSDQ